MPNLKDRLLEMINKIFNNKEIKFLPLPSNEQFMQDIIKSGLIKDFEQQINNWNELNRIENYYGERLQESDEKFIYNFPLKSQLSKEQTIELAKNFFESLGPEISNKANQVIDNKDSKFKLTFEKYGKTLDEKRNPREAGVNRK